MQRTPKVPVIFTQKDDESVIRSLRKRGAGEVDTAERLRILHHQVELSKK